jgi:hypothetical protein
MEKQGWKTIAIIFICLFTVETFYIGWAVNFVIEEEQKINECYYDICEQYEEADFADNVCSCYSYDLNNDLVSEKTETMYD